MSIAKSIEPIMSWSVRITVAVVLGGLLAVGGMAGAQAQQPISSGSQAATHQAGPSTLCPTCGCRVSTRT
jgi:hypothetical protein